MCLLIFVCWIEYWLTHINDEEYSEKTECFGSEYKDKK